MQRIKLTLPENFSFSTILPVRITDINYGGHLGNDTLLTLLHEARVQYLKSYNYTELAFAGVGLIMADAAIEYKHEIKYGDVLKCYVAAVDFDKFGFDVFYKLVILKDNMEVLAAKAKTGIICFDYTIGKKALVPEEAVKKLSEATG
jgi:acyl-CoA thioester hydrolase